MHLIEIVDALAEHDANEAVDITAGAVHSVRHGPMPLEPAAEHHVMLALVRAMLLDPLDQLVIVGPACLHGCGKGLDRSISAMLVVDVDRRQEVEITLAEPGTHTHQPNYSTFYRSCGHDRKPS